MPLSAYPRQFPGNTVAYAYSSWNDHPNLRISYASLPRGENCSPENLAPLHVTDRDGVDPSLRILNEAALFVLSRPCQFLLYTLISVRHNPHLHSQSLQLQCSLDLCTDFEVRHSASVQTSRSAGHLSSTTSTPPLWTPGRRRGRFC